MARPFSLTQRVRVLETAIKDLCTDYRTFLRPDSDIYQLTILHADNQVSAKFVVPDIFSAHQKLTLAAVAPALEEAGCEILHTMLRQSPGLNNYQKIQIHVAVSNSERIARGDELSFYFWDVQVDGYGTMTIGNAQSSLKHKLQDFTRGARGIPVGDQRYAILQSTYSVQATSEKDAVRLYLNLQRKILSHEPLNKPRATIEHEYYT